MLNIGLNLLNIIYLFNQDTILLSLKQLNFLLIGYAVTFEVASVIVGIYYFKKKYWIPMICTIIIALLVIIQTGTMHYGINSNKLPEIHDLYRKLHYLSLITGMTYGFSLVVGKARKEIMLLLYGVGIVTVASLITSIELSWKNEFVYQIASYLGCFTPTFLLLNLKKDLKKVRATNPDIVDAE